MAFQLAGSNGEPRESIGGLDASLRQLICLTLLAIFVLGGFCVVMKHYVEIIRAGYAVPAEGTIMPGNAAPNFSIVADVIVATMSTQLEGSFQPREPHPRKPHGGMNMSRPVEFRSRLQQASPTRQTKRTRFVKHNHTRLLTLGLVGEASISRRRRALSGHPQSGEGAYEKLESENPDIRGS